MYNLIGYHETKEIEFVIKNVILQNINKDFKNKDNKEYKNYHPWNQTIPYNFSKKIFYFQNSLNY